MQTVHGGCGFSASSGGTNFRSLLNILTSTSSYTVPRLHPGPSRLLQILPSEGPALLSPALQRLLACCLLPGPGAAPESGQVVAAALGVLARVLLHNGAFFLQFFEAAAAAQQPGAVNIQLTRHHLLCVLLRYRAAERP